MTWTRWSEKITKLLFLNDVINMSATFDEHAFSLLNSIATLFWLVVCGSAVVATKLSCQRNWETCDTNVPKWQKQDQQRFPSSCSETALRWCLHDKCSSNKSLIILDRCNMMPKETTSADLGTPNNPVAKKMVCHVRAKQIKVTVKSNKWKEKIESKVEKIVQCVSFQCVVINNGATQCMTMGEDLSECMTLGALNDTMKNPRWIKNSKKKSIGMLEQTNVWSRKETRCFSCCWPLALHGDSSHWPSLISFETHLFCRQVCRNTVASYTRCREAYCWSFSGVPWIFTVWKDYTQKRHRPMEFCCKRRTEGLGFPELILRIQNRIFLSLGSK